MTGELPEGWTASEVGGVFECWGGMTPSTANPSYWNGSTPWISSKDIKTPRIGAGTEFVTEAALRETRLRKCPPGTVLTVVRSGILAHTLPVALTTREVVVNQDIKALDSGDPGLNEWLALYLRAHEREILEANRKDGTTVQSVRVAELLHREMPLPPLAEQKRIVAKVEELLTRVNAARERLARVPAILRRFRKAVLAAACEGRLTEEWQERARPWAIERAVEVCAKVQSGGTPKEGFVDSPGIPFLKIYNIVGQRIDFVHRPQYLTRSVHEGSLAKSRTLPGDVLMNIVGPPLGKVAVVPETFPEWNINQALTLFRPSPRISTEWLYIILCDGANVEAVASETRGSAGQANISLTQCRNFQIPVPRLEEQREIVRHVEALFKLADAIERRLAIAMARAERIIQAVLAKGFRGELVPTEAELARREGRDYEPAAAMLEQIRVKSARREARPKANAVQRPERSAENRVRSDIKPAAPRLS